MKIRMTPILGWLFLAITVMFLATALAHAECPVYVVLARMSPVHTPALRVSYMNHTKKGVEGVKFSVKLNDATNDAHLLPGKFVSDHYLEAADYNRVDYLTMKVSDAATFDMVAWSNYVSRYGGEVWVDKVAFSDGSFWQDDGSHQCRAPISMFSVPSIDNN